MEDIGSVPIRPPREPNPMSPGSVVAGPLIPPIERIRLFSPGQWEDFVLEWAHGLRERYAVVERCAGAGDMGRDIVAYGDEGGDVWDNFQCKHYGSPLMPSQIWLEIGKLAYYTWQAAYTLPREYMFVAPHGAGTKLINLLRTPAKLRENLYANWEGYCTSSIRAGGSVPLEGELRDHLDAIDFSIFGSLPPLVLIDQHSQTRYHVARFGSDLPPRPDPAPPPAEPTDHESRFIRQLLRAYSEHSGRKIDSLQALSSDLGLSEHLVRARVEFYSAEALRLFSRDNLPPREFERLQDDFYHGVIDELEGDHENGYRRVLAVVRRAKMLPISHPLERRMRQADRGGICHQLVNDDRIKWVRDGD